MHSFGEKSLRDSAMEIIDSFILSMFFTVEFKFFVCKKFLEALGIGNSKQKNILWCLMVIISASTIIMKNKNIPCGSALCKYI